MSVYTTVCRAELEAFLKDYHLGELTAFEGISDGIENTNYFVTTRAGQFVLTLFEWLKAEELPYFLDLMAYLADHAIPSAHPIPDKQGYYLRELCGKPAALVRRLHGASVEHPTLAQCRAIGEQMGRLHTVGQSFKQHRANDRGPHWWAITARRVMPRLSEAERGLLQEEMEFQSRHRGIDLPSGVIHADLFRDNALFSDSQLTGIIDFYYACNDALIYDLAVTVNDWCNRADGGFDAERACALITAYRCVRPIAPMEVEMWPVMLRAAALRFWLSRLQDKHFPRQGEITHVKNPDVFRRILCHRREHSGELQAIWR